MGLLWMQNEKRQGVVCGTTSVVANMKGFRVVANAKGKRQGSACGVVSIVVNIAGSAKWARACVKKGEGAWHTTTLVASATTTNQFQSC